MSKEAPRRWTPEEDAVLREGFEAQAADNKNRATNWNEVAKRLPKRTNKDCRKRYYNHMAGNLKKGPWTDEEDTKLKSYVEEYGPAWVAVAQCMENRSAEQCSKRWNHCLDPELERQAWTDEEDQLLLRGVRCHGTSWKEIQTLHFACRSANNVKNRYTIISRRSMTAPPDALPCCSHGQNSEPPIVHASQNKASENDMTASDIEYAPTEAMDGVFSSDSSPLDFGLLQKSSTGLEATLDWNKDLLWDPSNPNDFDALLMFPDPTPTPIGADTEYFTASSACPPFDMLEGVNTNLSNLGSIDFVTRPSVAQQEVSPSSDSHGSDGVRICRNRGSESNSSRDSIGGSSASHVSCSSADSRYTITIDGAEPDTVMQVMNILVASRAMVNFQSS